MLRPWTQAMRSLLRRRAFTVGAILILSAGIAATAGVFSVVDSAVLKALPYPAPDRLVRVLEANSSKTERAGLLAPGRVEDWNRLNRTFDAIAASYAENVTETSGDTPERLASRRVTPRYFGVFRMTPARGRTFVSEEDVSGGAAAVVISDRLWARRFQHRADVLRQRLTLTGRSYAIVGVMPPDFDDGGVDLWIPAQTPPSLLAARDARFMTGVGRMKPGVTIAAAQRDLARVQTELGAQYPKTDKDWSAEVTDLKTIRVGAYREALIFVLGAVALLLLIALANTAGLMLTQLQRRENELAIRGCLGASRGQVVAGVVQEILIISGIATLAAMAADIGLLKIASTMVLSLPRAANGVSVDWRALLVASMCGAVAALVCGALPAWRATRPGVASLVSRAGRGISSNTRSQHILVAAQIALATLLLSSTALMLRSYYNLAHVDTGFDASRTVTFHVGAAWDEDRVKVARMQDDFIAALTALPGVKAAGFANFLPASDATIRYQVQLQDVAHDDNPQGKDLLTVGERGISSGYVEAIGARVFAGISCPSTSNRADAPAKALVNRRFMTKYANGESVVGRYLRWGPGQPRGAPMEVIGVLDDIREDNLRTDAVPYLYVCMASGNWPDPEYVVRTSGDPRALLASIRPTIRGVAPARAVFALMPLEENLGATLGQTRLQTEMVTAFGAAAVALAAIGLYGLVALAVTTRRREIGIRIALGAEPARVVRELAMSVARLIVAGAAVGLVLTIIAQRELRAVVFGVAPLDPLTIAGAILGLGLIAAAATTLPAWRASRIDPVGAMREG